MTQFPEIRALHALHALRDRIPGASFGLIETMVSALLGEKMIIKVYIYLISRAESRFISCTRLFVHMFRTLIYKAPNLAKSWNTYLHKRS